MENECEPVEATTEESLRKTIVAPSANRSGICTFASAPRRAFLAECGKLHRNNIEFNISLLDCRYICGDENLF